MSRSRYALLGILTLGPRAGSDIKRFIDESIAHFWSESYGNLYPRLHELLSQGLIECRTEIRDAAPEALVYSITVAGRAEFRRWMSQPYREQRVRDELLLRVFFANEVPVTQTTEQLERFAERQRDVLTVFSEVRRSLLQEYATDPNQPFWLMTLRRGEMVAEARLAWANECLAELPDMPLSPAETIS
ncbi:MAG TPA: PadR family transcriptional regulator [Longimicrobiales bacterium]